jgi:hypothetical protein
VEAALLCAAPEASSRASRFVVARDGGVRGFAEGLSDGVNWSGAVDGAGAGFGMAAAEASTDGGVSCADGREPATGDVSVHGGDRGREPSVCPCMDGRVVNSEMRWGSAVVSSL